MKTAVRVLVVLLVGVLLTGATCKKDNFSGNYQSGDGDLMLTLTKDRTFTLSSRTNPGSTATGSYDLKDGKLNLKVESGAAPVTTFDVTSDGKSMEGGGMTMIRQGD